MPRAYSIAEARDQLPALVHDAERGGRVSLTRRGKPVAVLISVSEYDRLTAGRTDFLGALIDFRARHDLSELDLGQALDDTRDGSPGRETDWG
ncbi:MAG: type II toxin-antitoxin system Phd/YefM family antitoxin [Myxococcota bacterium]